ncbi:MAG TPA: biopolymer transporter ExbD [Spirochaetota bacterium]|nr:biopolymer transporter ExbD [Spirochaetota bacterium]HPP04402.1 biopolymer transporter ExbD [Spirochaetota bacterium]
MKIKRKNRNIFDIADSGSMSDLAFLLIIFFIVIAIFNINKGFILGLPQKNSTKIVNIKDIIKINIKENGDIFYNKEKVTIDDIEKNIKEDLDNNPNLTVLLKIEENVKYQNVVNIIEIVRKLNVENFSFSIMKDGE